MKDAMKEYGFSFLHLSAGVIVIGTFISFLKPDGILHVIVANYISSICG